MHGEGRLSRGEACKTERGTNGEGLLVEGMFTIRKRIVSEDRPRKHNDSKGG